MNYFIIDKNFMQKHLSEFVSILKNVPNEYWSDDNFLLDLEGKWEYSIGIQSDNILIAFIIASVKTESIHIHKFMVHEDYRSKGIGKILLDYFVDMTCKNFNSITLKVYKDNQRAIDFYKANAFKKINSEHENLLEMIRRLV